MAVVHSEVVRQDVEGFDELEPEDEPEEPEDEPDEPEPEDEPEELDESDELLLASLPLESFDPAPLSLESLAAAPVSESLAVPPAPPRLSVR